MIWADSKKTGRDQPTVSPRTPRHLLLRVMRMRGQIPGRSWSDGKRREEATVRRHASSRSGRSLNQLRGVISTHAANVSPPGSTAVHAVKSSSLKPGTKFPSTPMRRATEVEFV